MMKNFNLDEWLYHRTEQWKFISQFDNYFTEENIHILDSNIQERRNEEDICKWNQYRLYRRLQLSLNESYLNDIIKINNLDSKTGAFQYKQFAKKVIIDGGELTDEFNSESYTNLIYYTSLNLHLLIPLAMNMVKYHQPDDNKQRMSKVIIIVERNCKIESSLGLGDIKIFRKGKYESDYLPTFADTEFLHYYYAGRTFK